MTNPNRKIHYDIDELIEIIEDPGKGCDIGMMLDSIVYAIKDLMDQLESLDNEYRGYDP